MKIFGVPDLDTTVLDALLDYIAKMESRRPVVVQYIMHYQRISVSARPCQLPLSLKVCAVMSNNRVITAFQAKPGAPIKITET